MNKLLRRRPCAQAHALWSSGAAHSGTSLIFSQGDGLGISSHIIVMPPAVKASGASSGCVCDAAGALSEASGGHRRSVSEGSPPTKISAVGQSSFGAHASWGVPTAHDDASIFCPWVGGEFCFIASRSVALPPSMEEKVCPEDPTTYAAQSQTALTHRAAHWLDAFRRFWRPLFAVPAVLVPSLQVKALSACHSRWPNFLLRLVETAHGKFLRVLCQGSLP